MFKWNKEKNSCTGNQTTFNSFNPINTERNKTNAKSW